MGDLYPFYAQNCECPVCYGTDNDYNVNALYEKYRENSIVGAKSTLEPVKPGTIGELISKAPDLRKEYPPIRLSDQAIPIPRRETLREVWEIVWGPLAAIALVVAMTVCIALIDADHDRKQAAAKERREKVAQEWRQETRRQEINARANFERALERQRKLDR